MEDLLIDHNSVATQYVAANGTRFSYRRFGKPSDVPVVFFQHFTGTMDNWDPIVTDGIAQHHEIILFNNKGLGLTKGFTPDTVEEMAGDALTFIDALGLEKIDLLGFSLGGFIAQLIAIQRPNLVRRIILAGTGPQGSVGLDNISQTVAIATEKELVERMLYMFFTDSDLSRTQGLAFLKRLQERKFDRDPDTSSETVIAQLKAIVRWGVPHDSIYRALRTLTHPVLIVNGRFDKIVPTPNSYTLYEHLSNARLSLYPDSGHGALFQYPELFVREVSDFLAK